MLQTNRCKMQLELPKSDNRKAKKHTIQMDNTFKESIKPCHDCETHSFDALDMKSSLKSQMAAETHMRHIHDVSKET